MIKRMWNSMGLSLVPQMKGKTRMERTCRGVGMPPGAKAERDVLSHVGSSRHSNPVGRLVCSLSNNQMTGRSEER